MTRPGLCSLKLQTFELKSAMESNSVQQHQSILSADAAIGAFKRSVGLARALRWLMLVAAVVLLSVSGQFSLAPFLAVAIFVPWIGLEVLSARSARLNRDATSLMAVGAFDAAEEKTTQALRLFSLHRFTKLNSLHQLAAIRHAQRRFADASKLARAVTLGMRTRDRRLGRSTRLVLVDSLIELNELDGAQIELTGLLGESLNLRETLNARQLQVELLGRLGAWPDLATNLHPLIDLAELMQSLPSARTHAWLALAARQTGQSDRSHFLRQRSELLADVEEIIKDRPALEKLWLSSPSTPPVTLENRN